MILGVLTQNISSTAKKTSRLDIGETPVILIDFNTREYLFICWSIYASVWKGRLPIVFDKYLSPFSLDSCGHFHKHM